MIVRLWRGRTALERAEEYLEYLNASGIPDLAGAEGNAGVFVLRRVDGEVAEFLILSVWESEEAIRGFAGQDCNKAVYYREDEDFLLHKELSVTHYEVVAHRFRA